MTDAYLHLQVQNVVVVATWDSDMEMVQSHYDGARPWRCTHSMWDTPTGTEAAGQATGCHHACTLKPQLATDMARFTTSLTSLQGDSGRMTPLDQVTDQRTTATETADQLKEAAVAAVDAGETITDVAQAAGVTRPTIYAWLRELETRRTRHYEA